MKETKLGNLFGQMTIKCPLEISSYGKCLLICKEVDTLQRGSCQKEFIQLLKCFEKVFLLISFIICYCLY